MRLERKGRGKGQFANEAGKTGKAGGEGRRNALGNQAEISFLHFYFLFYSSSSALFLLLLYVFSAKKEGKKEKRKKGEELLTLLSSSSSEQKDPFPFNCSPFFLARKKRREGEEYKTFLFTKEKERRKERATNFSFSVLFPPQQVLDLSSLFLLLSSGRSGRSHIVKTAVRTKKL